MPEIVSADIDRCFACGTPLSQVEAVYASRRAISGAADLLAVLAWRDGFQAAHQDIVMTTPFENASRMWEVRTPGKDTEFFNDGGRMMSVLTARYAS